MPLPAEVRARLGERTEARNLLTELEGKFKTQDLPATSIAQAYLALGDKEQALTWLAATLKPRCPSAIYITVDPAYEPLHADPRFAALVNKMGLGTG